MDYFGDESGQFNALLSGEEHCISHAVIKSPSRESMTCSNKVVRSIKNVSEVKWNDMRYEDKRRFLDCFSKRESDIHVATATITQSDIKSLDHNYLLYQDSLQYISPIMFAGIVYGGLLIELDIHEDSTPSFKFDRLYSKKQSNKVTDVVLNQISHIDCSSHNSQNIRGIQSADCIAGAVREDCYKNTSWMNHLQN